MYKMMREFAENLTKDASQFTSELIRTQSRSNNEKAAAELVAKKLQELGFDKVFIDDIGNVVGILFGYEAKPTLLLNTHLDTVTPLESDPIWEDTPYSGTIKNGKIYGVGASDCKSGIAAQIYGAHMLLHRTLIPLRGNLIIAVTVSEENGLSLGVQHLISKTLPDLKMSVDYAVLGEPTDLGLFYGHDGWAEFTIGMDSPNPNFLYDATRAVYQNLFNASNVNNADGSRVLMTVNQPEYSINNSDASITFNKRIFEDENTDKVISNIKDISLRNIREKKSLNLEIKLKEEIQRLSNGEKVQVRYLSNAWETNPFSALMDRSRQALSSAGCKTLPGKWQLPRVGMGTAGSILIKKFGVPTIGYGPGNENAAHAAGEFVEIKNIQECILGTASIIHNLIGIPVFGWTSDMDI
ncbi:MAG TPA: M20/M25/M40 family metallo-hydrolase [Ignavibacteriaceae bacterium]|nr:M20/M25/M40 family metallo-hydrolase [Ignavibacteriaceae bacterium]